MRCLNIVNNWLINIGLIFLISITISCSSQKELNNNASLDQDSFELFLWSRDINKDIVIHKKNLKKILYKH